MGQTEREALSLYVTGIDGIAFLAGLRPMVNMLATIGWLFATALVFGMVLFLIARVRQGRSMVNAILTLVIIGLVSFTLIYGAMWYVLKYMPEQGASILQFNSAAPIPQATIASH